jgi:hypothetical protein
MNPRLKKLIYISKIVFIVIAYITISLALFQFLFCPVYVFPEPKAFSGEKIFNPYQNIDSTAWKKGIFHVHTHSWLGLTNGSKNSEQAIDSMYKYLGYDIICISDYQRINYYNRGMNDFVPVYEHGYMLNKNHQLVIGAKKVCWLDYPFSQSLNNKQHIIFMLKKDKDNVVTIAHPRTRNAYSLEDMKYLAGYDCMEAFDYLWYSKAHWDAALSSGHIAYVMGDDDNHDISNPFLVGCVCTFVNTKQLSATSTMQSLKEGRSFACEIYVNNVESFPNRLREALALPVLKTITVKGTCLTVCISKPAAYFLFVGQNGNLKKKSKNTNCASYDLTINDTYIRTEIHLTDSNVFYLNPVFRYDGNKPQNPLVSINHAQTAINRLIFYASLAMLFSLSVFLFRKKKPTSDEKK